MYVLDLKWQRLVGDKPMMDPCSLDRGRLSLQSNLVDKLSTISADPRTDDYIGSSCYPYGDLKPLVWARRERGWRSCSGLSSPDNFGCWYVLRDAPGWYCIGGHRGVNPLDIWTPSNTTWRTPPAEQNTNLHYPFWTPANHTVHRRKFSMHKWIKSQIYTIIFDIG